MSLLDAITRICKNAAGDVLAVQTLSVIARTICTADVNGNTLSTAAAQSTSRFLRTASIEVATQKFVVSSADQTVATVDTTGMFDSYTTDAGDVDSVTYTGTDPVNDITLGVSTDTRVIVAGDTV